MLAEETVDDFWYVVAEVADDCTHGGLIVFGGYSLQGQHFVGFWSCFIEHICELESK